MLTQFTRPEILRQIGPIRVAKFLNSFKDNLAAAPPDFLSTIKVQSGSDEPSVDFTALAAALALTHRLPAGLRNALFTLEVAASPENHDRLQDAIHRRIPCIGVNWQCPLDCALELWFAVPDELAQFAPPPTSSTIPPPASSIQNPASSIEHPASSIQNPASLVPLPTQPPTINSQPSSNSEPSAPPSTIHSPPSTPLDLPPIKPWHEPVDGILLLDELVWFFKRCVVLPMWAAETLALWIVHTYAFMLRDVSTYIGVESPVHRCGKTTLLKVLYKLANRAVASANISSPAFFHAVQDLQPTLLIDEVDTFLPGNEELKGILNAGYTRDTGYVMRISNQSSASHADKPLPLPSPATTGGEASMHPLDPRPSTPDTRHSNLVTFSCWCPKVISRIGHLPETLADRCIIIRMQRKMPDERCERVKNLDGTRLKRQCVRFVLDHAQQIAAAQPDIPQSLNDRAADIWEPLLVLADLAGGKWPELARQAAVGLTASAQDNSPITSLLLDTFLVFADEKVDRIFTRTLLARLIGLGNRPWLDLLKGKAITETWFAEQLRPYGIRPRTLRIGDLQAKGYLFDDCKEAFRRYIPKSEFETFLADSKPIDAPHPKPENPDPSSPNTQP